MNGGKQQRLSAFLNGAGIPFHEPRRGKAVVRRSFVGQVVSDSKLKAEPQNKTQQEVSCWKESS